MKKLFLALCGVAVLISSANADVLCVLKKAAVKNSKLSSTRLINVFPGTTCPAKYRLVLATTAFTGPAGPTGATGATGTDGTNGSNGSAGADGQLRVYGDGSAGPLNVNGAETITSGNLQFTDCNITASGSLQVPSGTILRCSGNVTIAGNIFVDSGASGGYVDSASNLTTNIYTAASSQANPGRNRTAPGNGEIGSSAFDVRGAKFTFALGDAEARISYIPSILGGSGGGGSLGIGGTGGGYFAILAQGTITLASTALISSAGVASTNGGGGGGGGFVVLASKTSVTVNSGAVINVAGGAGGASSATCGAGGGGGGGAIHVIAPSSTVASGGFDVSGGDPGSNATPITQTVAIAGGAGGAAIGSGGQGGDVASGRPSSSGAGQGGAVGFFFQLTADPTALF